MAKLIKKAINVYKNRGISGLADKTARFAGKRARRLGKKLSFKREGYDEKRLREEFEFVSNDVFQITNQDIELSKQACGGSKPVIETALWFIPQFSHFGFNGIQTIFRFIEKMSLEGVHNHLVIYDSPTFDTSVFETQMKTSFPGISSYTVHVFGDDKEASIKKLPASDIAFCTFWVSAYILLRYNQTKRKYYFIQDYEPQFYEAGSTSALAESTYRFGFKGIVNTPGLLAAVNQRHGMEGVSFIPAVNRQLYYPNPNKKNKRVRIFLYARPLNPRNAFNLGILTIKELLAQYPDDIEIITAGADWDEAEHGLQGLITNLGLLKSLDQVADLYRTCDIGFSYMLTPHTSYQMLEYTASGMATVMNYNEDHAWLHKNGVNCLLAEPSPAAMAEQIGKLIVDEKLRRKLVKTAEKELGYTWDQQMDMIWNDVKNSKS
jgi:glycosyltransferase involved in cell wall biosynthesis